MKVYLPKNIFSAVFVYGLSSKADENFIFEPSSVLSTKLDEDENAVGLIPSLDLIKHKNLFVSKNTGISFDGSLSNSFLYFVPKQQNFSDLFLKGDISLNEILLAKILFSEKYGTEIVITLDTKPSDFSSNNYLIAGNENFDSEKIDEGISFADEISDLIDYPYVNYLVASASETSLKQFTSNISQLDRKLEDSLSQILNSLKISDSHKKYITDNFNSIYFDLTDNELRGLEELLRLPYYKGIIEEVCELKLI